MSWTDPRICVICGATYTPRTPVARTCGPVCSKANTNRANRALWIKRKTVALEEERLGGPLPDDRTRVDNAPWPVIAATGGHDRQTYCAHYDDCLDVAVRLRWPGFACRECPVRGTCDVKPEAPRASSPAAIAIDNGPEVKVTGEGLWR